MYHEHLGSMPITIKKLYSKVKVTLMETEPMTTVELLKLAEKIDKWFIYSMMEMTFAKWILSCITEVTEVDANMLKI